MRGEYDAFQLSVTACMASSRGVPKQTYLQAQFRRLAAIRGNKHAIVAVGSTILTIDRCAPRVGSSSGHDGLGYPRLGCALYSSRRKS